MSQFAPNDMARRAASDPDAEAAQLTQRAEAAVGQLEQLAELPTAQHVEVFESVQQALSDTLSAVDEA